MSAAPSGPYVHTGPWINWSKGLVHGATLTLSEGSGGLLTAFLAIYVGLVGGCFWTILCYVFHRSRLSHRIKDVLYHQQQVILRNNGGPASAAWEFLRLGWCWRELARKPIIRSLPLALAALLNLAFFGVASVFSSEVAKAPGNETLVRDSSCGFWFPVGASGQQETNAFQTKDLVDTVYASTYARSCYSESDGLLDCNRYVVPRIDWTINANASCPFALERCFMGDTTAYEMDTGPIDSHHMLGLNAPERDRVSYRKKTTCALIDQDAARLENGSNPVTFPGGDTYEYERYYYGPLGNVTNYTYQYNVHSYVAGSGYGLDVVEAYAEGGSLWEPSPAINRTDADVSLYFLSPNNIWSPTPIDDPWFSFHTQLSGNGTGELEDPSMYQSDYWMGVLGCVDQYQVCSVTNPSVCTRFGGRRQMGESIQQIELNPVERVTAMHLAYATTFIGTGALVRSQGPNALMAREKVYAMQQLALSNTQWHIEVSSWMAVGLARLQQIVVEYATASTGVHPGLELQEMPSEIEQRFCRNQKVRHSGEHTSFSILGMIIVLVCGAAIIILSLFVDTLGDWLQGRAGKSRRQCQWRLNEKLHLQRLAYEAAGKGDWSATTDVVPVILAGHNQILGALGEEEGEEEEEKVDTHQKHSSSGASTTKVNVQAITRASEEELALQPSSSPQPQPPQQRDSLTHLS